MILALSVAISLTSIAVSLASCFYARKGRIARQRTAALRALRGAA